MEPESQKILVVDDEPALLKMMGVYLKRVGYTVTLFGSSDLAWNAVAPAVGEYAAAVLDATLSGMSAHDLALKLAEANPSLCIVMASGYPVDMSALEAAAPRRVSFVQKPFTADALTGALRRLLGPEETAV
jgi:DNA-binding NtrC family response regulator